MITRQSGSRRSEIPTIRGATIGGGVDFDDSPGRISGAMPGIATALEEWAHEQDVLALEGATSISGGMAKTREPAAMMARGSRVTGSGAAALFHSSPPAWDTGGVIELTHGSQVIFACIEQHAAKNFL